MNMIARNIRRLHLTALRPFENALGGTSVCKEDVLRSLSDTDVYEEADRRGFIDDDEDYEQPLYLGHISDYDLRQDIAKALREVEKVLSDTDSRFIGFAEDVARHFGDFNRLMAA